MSYSKFYNPEETLSREEIKALQLERLQATVKHCMNSPFYKERFRKAGLSPSDIKTLDDLRKIPFTTKQDLRDTYPFGIASVPLDKCVRLHSSSGTTGNPTVILHTQKDLDEWANAVARCLWMVGCRPEDVFQNTSGYGMFTGGLGFQYGAEKVGMLTVPAAAGNTLRQLKFFTDFGTTVVHAIPSYAARLYEVMCEKGIDPRKDTKLRTLVIGAEPHSEDTRKRIEEMLSVKAYNSFGMSEMCGPGVAFECPEQNGMHIWEDYYIVEIVDPDTLEPVPDGEVGELVLTTLKREAMPLLRYRTRDLTRILPGETILMQFQELASDYLITLETVDGNDAMTVDVEMKDLFIDDYSKLQALNREITRQLRDEILITPKVRLVPKNSLPKSEGKAGRVVDTRKKY